MTDNRFTLQAHIDNFDRLLTTADFEESVRRDQRSMIFIATFEVFLTNDFRVSIGASVGAGGELLDVNVYLYDRDGRDDDALVVADLPVERDSGLWRAMEIWLNVMGDAPESD